MYSTHIKKLTTDNTTMAGINYKEQYECESNPLDIARIILCVPAFLSFCKYLA